MYLIPELIVLAVHFLSPMLHKNVLETKFIEIIQFEYHAKCQIIGEFLSSSTIKTDEKRRWIKKKETFDLCNDLPLLLENAFAATEGLCICRTIPKHAYPVCNK